MRFADMVKRASGHDPYPWQVGLAESGLPDLIAVETGAGKTAGVVLSWLYRRRFHPDPAVSAATPHWLVVCLPLRTLVEQTEDVVRGWLHQLGLAEEVLLHVAMGGREDARDPWRLHPEKDAVVIGTVDMLLSRALNRGYGASRFSWPIDFGLLNSGVQWVFDEIQLLGPALPTSRQLEAFRRELGTAMPTASTWMSATVDEQGMQTVDNAEIGTVVCLTGDDRADPRLATRLGATRLVRELDVGPSDPKRATLLAEALAEAHRAGTLSLAVVNTVRTAREVAAALRASGLEAPVTLLHSRYRPSDRQSRLKEVLKELDPDGPGRLVVSTQVVEAGVDLSAAVLLTEAAPWPSVVQRAGRCNRDGLAGDAQLLWAPVAKASPYEQVDVDAATAALRALEGERVTSTRLRELDVPTTRMSHAVLRKRDFIGLFDTAPDLSGNDVDVAPFIRVGDDLDAQLTWRALEGAPPAPDDPGPTAAELCPVPAGQELRDYVLRGLVWRVDHLGDRDSRWVRATRDDVRPGIVLVADARHGGYTAEGGWDAGSKAPVESLYVESAASLVVPEECLGDEPLSLDLGRWVELECHLADVEAAVRQLCQALKPHGLTTAMVEAAAVAGRLHDIGKAHEVFQDTLARCAPEEQRESIRAGGPWAKSGGGQRARHSRHFFRHELASALALLGEAAPALDGIDESELVVYLVAAHHGRVRLGIRSVPEEERSGTVLGILRSGDRLPAMNIPGSVLPISTLSLDGAQLGRADDGTPSWSERTLVLRDRADLGPLRLGFLEAVVRLADWRASASSEHQA